MAHDTHFLERLSRVSLGQTERALGLYRDPELVRAVLNRAQVGDQAERVAIALEEGPDSPHLVVDRAGHFITCLGPGMSPGSLPRVTRAQLDGVIARTGRERVAREMLDGLKDRSRMDLKRLFRKVWEKSSQVSDEDIRPLLGMAPLLAAPLQVEALRSGAQIMKETSHLTSLKQSAASLRGPLEEFWNRHFQVGHFALLAAAGADHLSEEAATKMDEEQIHLLSLLAYTGSLMPQAARVLWAIARRAPRLLPRLKQFYGQVALTPFSQPIGAALVASTCGHQRLRTEIRKTLERTPASSGGSEEVYQLQLKALQALQSLWLPFIDQPAAHWEQQKRIILEALGGQLPVGLGDSATDGAMMAAIIQAPIEAFDDSLHGYVFLLSTLHWLARAQPEQLYLPASALARPELAFTPERGMQLVKMASRSEEMLRQETVRAEPRPGRNEPCTCGSGKKYKRCCGLGGGSEGAARP